MKEFWQKLGIEPVTGSTCLTGSVSPYFGRFFYPDILSDTPNAAYNRELLEECVLKVYENFEILIEHINSNIKIFYNFIGLVDKYNWQKTRSEALKSLCEKIADEIKPEVQKIKDKFIY
jgi:hypothetical protein